MTEEVYRCVHCGFCLPTCPTYLATGVEGHSPRGRLYLMRAVAEGRLKADRKVLEYLDACVYCFRCETACPSGVRYGAAYEEFFRRHRELGRVTYRRYMPLFEAANAVPALAPVLARLNRELASVAGGRAPWDLLGRTYPAKGEERRGRVALFVGRCLAWAGARRVVEAAIRVLTWNGYEVVVPRLSCCGAPYRHGGRFEKAERLAERNLAALSKVGPVDAVVVPDSGGCLAELIRYVKAVDAVQLLADGLRGNLGPVEMKVAVQHSCHLMNAAKAHEAVLRALSRVPGLKLVPLPSADVCCGGGNMYPLRHRRIAEAILDRKRREVEELRPDAILVESPSCRQQLSKLGTRLVTPVELLDASYMAGGNEGYEALHPTGGTHR